MIAVKVLPKFQITLPIKIRRKLSVHEGDTLVLEESADGITLKKGKTLFDFRGSLPNLGLSADEMREKATRLAMKDDE